MPTNREFWKTRIGPLYDSNGVQKLTGFSGAALSARIAARDILMVRTVAGEELFPAFQFEDDGQALPAAANVAILLEPIADDAWDVALWLNTRTHRFNGHRAVDELRAGRIAQVLAWAAHDGQILNS